MNIKNWKYYNHAVIPTTPPHEDPDISAILDGSIWQLEGRPLLARWTTNFDCSYETNWWYIVKDAPYNIDDVSSKERKSIRQSLRKCYVEKVKLIDHMQEIYACYRSAVDSYENAYSPSTYEQFESYCKANNSKVDCWVGYDNETDLMIGYVTVCAYDCYAEIETAKFMPKYLNKQVSDALYHNILDYYLNGLNKSYISSGQRSINHITNTQEYKIRRFGYRKAFCKLHLKYNPKIAWIIKLVYPFRKILSIFDRINKIHLVNAILAMEEISRSAEKQS